MMFIDIELTTNGDRRSDDHRPAHSPPPAGKGTAGLAGIQFAQVGIGCLGVNDPSAGSPTETLLRLLLPLNDKV